MLANQELGVSHDKTGQDKDTAFGTPSGTTFQAATVNGTTMQIMVKDNVGEVGSAFGETPVFGTRL